MLSAHGTLWCCRVECEKERCIESERRKRRVRTSEREGHKEAEVNRQNGTLPPARPNRIRSASIVIPAPFFSRPITSRLCSRRHPTGTRQSIAPVQTSTLTPRRSLSVFLTPCFRREWGYAFITQSPAYWYTTMQQYVLYHSKEKTRGEMT